MNKIQHKIRSKRTRWAYAGLATFWAFLVLFPSVLAYAASRAAASNRVSPGSFFAPLRRKFDFASQASGSCSSTGGSVAAWFSMDNASGNLTVPSGCAASGTVFTASGTPTYHVSNGVPNGLNTAIGVAASPASFFATGANVAALNPGTSPLVVEGWFHDLTGSPGSAGYIIGKKADGNPTSAGWALKLQGNTTVAMLAADGTNQCSVSASYSLAAWHYVRGTWNGTNTCTIAVDGATVTTATQAVTSVTNTGEADIAADSGHADRITAQIADLRVCIGATALTCNLGYNDGTAAHVSNTTSGRLTSTFTRSTTATTCQNNTITTIASGVPRFDDGTCSGSASPLGYVSEGGGANLLLSPEAFDNASWTKTRATVTANADMGPAADSTADFLKEDSTATNTHFTTQTVTKAASAIAYTFTIYAKANGRTRIEIQASTTAGGTGVLAGYDLAGGSVWTGPSGIGGAPFTSLSASISSTTVQGYYRCALSFTTNTDTNVLVNVLLDSGSGAGARSVTYTGDGTSGVYLWHAQLKQQSFAQRDIPVGVTQAADSMSYNSTGIWSESTGTVYAEDLPEATFSTVTTATVIGNGAGTATPLTQRQNTSGVGSYDGTNNALGPTGTPTQAVVKAAATWSGSSLTAYANGTAGSVSAYDGSFGLTSIGIGGSGASPAGYTTIRNVLIYTRALTASEVSTLSNAFAALDPNQIPPSKRTPAERVAYAFADLISPYDGGALRASIDRTIAHDLHEKALSDFEADPSLRAPSFYAPLVKNTDAYAWPVLTRCGDTICVDPESELVMQPEPNS